MNLEETARAYFTAFENKDIDNLSERFQDTVSLKDWNSYAEGKESVLKANADIFKSTGEITVTIRNLYVCDLTVVAELMIFFDGGNALPVVDIIKFTSTEKIESIVAYRGN